MDTTRLILLLVLPAAWPALAPAADPIPATAAATQPSNKWQYNLFNPTPADQLRGMDTDRPNKTNTPHTIDAGHLQIETGFFDYTDYQDHYQGANSRGEMLDVGQFNYRLGILNNLELNAVLNSYDFSQYTDYLSSQSVRQNGVGDTVLGGKFNVWGNESGDDVWATALGVQPQLKIPTARQDIGNGHAELFVGVPFLMNLPGDFHLGLQTTVSWERSFYNTGDVTGWQNMASVDRVLFDKFDVYLEYWSHLSTERHQESQQTLDTGFTYPLDDNIVLDTGINFGLTRASNTIEWLSGISVRF